MIRIGAVTIDTSHPLAFGGVLEKDPRAKYVGVFNDSFRSDDEVEGFVKRFGLEKRCRTIEELADMCDIGFIHSCNWDKHLAYAMPFVKKGKPVFIDKPLVGNLEDCRKLTELVRGGAVILGASSVRYAEEIVKFVETPASERGEIVSLFGTSGVDEFNYGIHVVEGIGALAGHAAQSVRFLGRGVKSGMSSESFYIDFGNGVNAVYNTFMGSWQPFVYTIMTTKTTSQFVIDTGKIYRALLNEIICFMEGKPNRLAAMPELLDSVEIMLAGRISRERNGAAVNLGDIPNQDKGYDGQAFFNEYSAAAKKMYC